MIEMSLKQIADVLDGKLIGGNSQVSTVITDTRQVNDLLEHNKSLFIALKGPRFDAHEFIDSVDGKVACVIVDHPCEISTAQIVVENTHKALAELARFNRLQSKASVVAITGSSGKTTVKEMIAAILSLNGPTLATEGNFNNDIGAPLTLLKIASHHQYAVIELGANHEGEIAFTADITQADVAMVNNVAESHLEGFGDLQGVARAKSEIYYALTKKGIAVVNRDDAFYSFFEQRIECQMIKYSINQSSDVHARNIVVNQDQSCTFDLHFKDQSVTIRLALIGQHNVANALAAASCCFALGISINTIAEGLSLASSIAGRLVVRKLSSGCQLIDDSYNANVASMTAAINLLSQFSGTRILVIGDMAELGEHARECHQQIGVHAREVGIDRLLSCGVLTQFAQRGFSYAGTDNQSDKLNVSSNEDHFSEQADLIKTLIKEAKNGVTILVKGSRSAHMENVIKALENEMAHSSADRDIEKTSAQNIASLAGDQ